MPSNSVPPPGSGGPSGPNPSGPAQPNAPTPPPPQGAAPTGGGKTTQFLGMTFDPEQTKQLNNIMIQNIGNQIQKYNDEGIKAIKNFQKVSEGEEPDE